MSEPFVFVYTSHWNVLYCGTYVKRVLIRTLGRLTLMVVVVVVVVIRNVCLLSVIVHVCRACMSCTVVELLE